MLLCYESRHLIQMENGMEDIFSTSVKAGGPSRPQRSTGAGVVEEDPQLLRHQTGSVANGMRSIGASKGLNMVHLNARSLLTKISELQYLCQESNVSV